MKKSVFYILFCCLPFQFFAQDSLTIQSIEFEGLEKTKEGYLLQFLKSKEGDFFVTTHLQNDIQQLWNVGTNQFVDAQVDSLPNQKVKITFQLKEKKTLLPIINVGGVQDNIWFQLGAIDFNWSGRGHQLLAFYQNTDGRHGGQLYYRIPYLNRKWGIAANLLQFRSKEPLYFPEGEVLYYYNNINGGLTLIRNFSFRKRLEFGGNVFRENYKKTETQTIPNPPGPNELTELKVSSKLEYNQNLLDYKEYYLHGWAWRGIWQTVYNFKDGSVFNSFIFQTRRFYRMGKKGNFAARFRFGISTNNDSPFAPFVVDSRVNLRGSGNRIERGTGQLILNLEYRRTFLDKKNWAIQGIVFSDLGNWRSPGGELSDFFNHNDLRNFVGGGFRVIYKRVYDAILRVDYGIDINDLEKHGIVIGIGQYF